MEVILLTLHISTHLWFITTHQVRTIVIPLLQMGKLRLREIIC